jgi:hypothetical protein
LRLCPVRIADRYYIRRFFLNKCKENGIRQKILQKNIAIFQSCELERVKKRKKRKKVVDKGERISYTNAHRSDGTQGKPSGAVWWL